MTRGKRPTLKDIAREVGVHVSTISRALNGASAHAVSPDLARKIWRASKRHGYTPNAAAVMLKTNRSRTVGVVIPDITDPVFPPIIRGIEDGLARHGYVAILANTDGDPRRQVQAIETLRPRGIDALIVASALRHDADVSRLTAGMAVVTVSRRTDDPRFSSVVHDEDDGMRRIVTHLASLGHQRIAAIAGPQAVSTGYNRYASYACGIARGSDWRRTGRSSRLRAPSTRRRASAAPRSCSSPAGPSRPSSAPTTAWPWAPSRRCGGTGSTAPATSPSPASTIWRWRTGCRPPSPPSASITTGRASRRRS